MGSKLHKVSERDTIKHPSGRSLSFWVIWLIYIWMTFTGWERFTKGIVDYYWLNLAGLVPGPDYIIGTGLLWGLVGLAVVAWMVMGKPGYRQAAYGLALFFMLTYWADRVFFTQSMGDRHNMLFSALLTLICLLYVTAVLRPFPAKQAEAVVEVKQTEHSQSL